MKGIPVSGNKVEEARNRWLVANERAANLAEALFKPGDGYGNPEARMQDEHRLWSAQKEADRCFLEYQDLDRREIDRRILELQVSQRLATWASFAVAFVVGIATVFGIILDLPR